jgi:hypothetical protein
MEIVAVLITVFVGFAVFFFVVKRLLRTAIRVALLGALLFAMFAGAVAWWWSDPLGRRAGDAGRSNRNAASRPARAR